MNFEAHKLILITIDALREQGNWTGRTHVIKALFLASCKTSLPFEFVLYKHGPYSFDVDGELEQMKSYDAVKTEQVVGYGPRLKRANGSAFLKDVSIDPSSTTTVLDACRFVGTWGVIELEALATSAWVRTREGSQLSSEVESRVRALKPHIPEGTARWADEQIKSRWLN